MSALVSLVLLVSLVGCSSEARPQSGPPISVSSSPTSSPSPSTSTSTAAAPVPGAPPTVPARGAYFGGWRGPGPGRPESAPESMDQAELAIGRPYAIDHRYYDWGSEIPSGYDRETAAEGRIPMVSLCSCRFGEESSVSWADIAAGTQDVYLVATAQRFADWGVPAFLVFDSEPEDHLATHGTPDEYRAAWRHIVGVFRSVGARNVAFVWTTTAYALRGDPEDRALVESLYPGDDVVDWIGVDPYNFNQDGVWQSFRTALEPWYRWVTTKHPKKPLMLTEWGSKEDPNDPDRKGAWLLDARDQLRTRYRLVKAAVYFDEEKFERGTVNDWRIDTSAESLAAFRAIASDGWFAITP